MLNFLDSSKFVGDSRKFSGINHFQNSWIQDSPIKNPTMYKYPLLLYLSEIRFSYFVQQLIQLCE